MQNETIEDNEELTTSLNEISYKMDSIIHFQEQQYSSSVIFSAILVVFVIAVIIYKFIKNFVDF